MIMVEEEQEQEHLMLDVEGSRQINADTEAAEELIVQEQGQHQHSQHPEDSELGEGSSSRRVEGAWLSMRIQNTEHHRQSPRTSLQRKGSCGDGGSPNAGWG